MKMKDRDLMKAFKRFILRVSELLSWEMNSRAD